MSLGSVLPLMLLLGSAPPSGQPQAVRCPQPQGHLTLEAFSRMAAGGAFSVWDITKSVTSSSEVQALRSFIAYHSVHPRNPSRAHVILQVELTVSDSGELQQVTGGWLEVEMEQLHVEVWQEPASVGGGLRLLVEGFVDLHQFQTVPHKLNLLGGEGGSVPIATLDNIMLR